MQCASNSGYCWAENGQRARHPLPWLSLFKSILKNIRKQPLPCYPTTTQTFPFRWPLKAPWLSWFYSPLGGDRRGLFYDFYDFGASPGVGDNCVTRRYKGTTHKPENGKLPVVVSNSLHQGSRRVLFGRQCEKVRGGGWWCLPCLNPSQWNCGGGTVRIAIC